MLAKACGVAAAAARGVTRQHAALHKRSNSCTIAHRGQTSGGENITAPLLTMMMRPPGAHTRASSRTNCRLSAKKVGRQNESDSTALPNARRPKGIGEWAHCWTHQPQVDKEGYAGRPAQDVGFKPPSMCPPLLPISQHLHGDGTTGHLHPFYTAHPACSPLPSRAGSNSICSISIQPTRHVLPALHAPHQVELSVAEGLVERICVGKRSTCGRGLVVRRKLGQPTHQAQCINNNTEPAAQQQAPAKGRQTRARAMVQR